MDHRSSMEMIYLGIEYLLIGSFLIMVTYAMSLREDFAGTRNSKIASEHNIRQYREFNAYDLGECDGVQCTNHVYGDEVIQVIRRYYDDPDFEIYIDKTSETGKSLKVNAAFVAASPETYSLENLQKIIDSRSEFHPYLIYNGIEPSSISRYQPGLIGTVTGITFCWKSDNKVVQH